MGGLEDRRRRRRRRRPGACAAPQRGRALGRLPGLVCARRRDVGDGRAASLRDPRGVRLAHRRAVREPGRPGPTRVSRSGSAATSRSSVPGTTRTRSSRRSRLQGGVDLSQVYEGRDVVALARATFDGIGLETGPILERSDLYPRDGKCQHAFCIDVDREGDVRVLANVVPDRYWADTMLHELGHGVFDLGFDQELPWLLRDCHLTITEGIAILMGRLAQEAGWLRDVVGVEADEAASLDGRAERRPGRGRARVHALGAGHDELRARLLRRSGGRSLGALVEPRLALPARRPAGRPSRSPTGPRRSTSPARRSTTTRTSTGTSSPRSCAPRSSARPAVSSAARRRGAFSRRRSSDPANRCVGTDCSRAPRASP